jgi:outer membrane protein insertion porin family
MKIKFLLFSLFLLNLIFTRVNSQIISSDEIEIDYNNPKEYEIGGITIDGSDYLDKNVLIQSTDLIIGEEISVPGGKISKAVKNLWDLNLFSDVTIYVTKIIGKKIFLNIQLEERPRLSKFQISGIRKGLADDVREKIKLIRGKIVTENLVVNTKNRISEFFIDKGYLDAEISITQKPDTTAQNQVILFIAL